MSTVLAVVEERLELVNSKGFGTVLAYCKHDGVEDVALARAVRSSDCNEALLKVHDGVLEPK